MIESYQVSESGNVEIKLHLS
jgi:hypothetical protein